MIARMGSAGATSTRVSAGSGSARVGRVLRDMVGSSLVRELQADEISELPRKRRWSRAERHSAGCSAGSIGPMTGDRPTGEDGPVTFVGLLAHNVWRRRLRAVVTAIAVAIGVTAVLALGVLTSSLRETAVSVLQIGKADFSVSQKGASDVLYSTMSKQEIDAIRADEGRRERDRRVRAHGQDRRAAPVLHRDRPRPDGRGRLRRAGRRGRSFTGDRGRRDDARLARGAGLRRSESGDRFKVEERTFRVVGHLLHEQRHRRYRRHVPDHGAPGLAHAARRVHARLRASVQPARERSRRSPGRREGEPATGHDRDRQPTSGGSTATWC